MPKLTFRLSPWLPLGLLLLLPTVGCTQPPDTNGLGNAGSTPAVVESSASELEVAPDRLEDTESLLALSGDGLQLVGDQTGSTNPLVFGTEMALVEEAVTSILGAPLESVENSECGSGPQTITQWPNGLTLHAAGGEFIGWSASANTDAALTTMAGVGIGSTRSDLEAAYAVEVSESSLGTEFSTGDLFGILSSSGPDAVIENLWAGTVCNFR